MVMHLLWLEQQDHSEVVRMLMIFNQVADNWNMVGMRATESHDLILNDVFIPEENFVEIRGAGGKQPNGWILHIPSTYLGIAQAARDYAVDFAKIIVLQVLMV